MLGKMLEAPCVLLDAQRTLCLFEATHRAFPKIDFDFRADAVKPDACVDFA